MAMMNDAYAPQKVGHDVPDVNVKKLSKMKMSKNDTTIFLQSFNCPQLHVV
jgi:hypothetical protein